MHVNIEQITTHFDRLKKQLDILMWMAVAQFILITALLTLVTTLAFRT